MVNFLLLFGYFELCKERELGLLLLYIQGRE